MTMIEALEDMCAANSYEGDFLSRFDLIGGVSVGGVAALVSSQCTNT